MSHRTLHVRLGQVTARHAAGQLKEKSPHAVRPEDTLTTRTSSQPKTPLRGNVAGPTARDGLASGAPEGRPQIRKRKATPFKNAGKALSRCLPRHPRQPVDASAESPTKAPRRHPSSPTEPAQWTWTYTHGDGHRLQGAQTARAMHSHVSGKGADGCPEPPTETPRLATHSTTDERWGPSTPAHSTHGTRGRCATQTG